MNETSYIYEKILSKMKYDNEREQYVIKLSDYGYLNISNKQFRILKQICHKKGICLEYTNTQIPIIEDKLLFKEYNEIKERLSIEPDNQFLENKRIEIRNKIASQNFKAVRILLNRRITGLPQMKDKEDIYQIGYQCLIEFIDSYDILKEKVFTTAINRYLIYHISRKVIAYQKNITNYASKCMDLVNEILGNDEQKNLSTKELSELTNIPEHHVKSLFNLDEILTPIYIDEELDKLEIESIDKTKSPLYYDTFEIDILNELIKDTLMKIIRTLPIQQQEIIILYYGLDGDRNYNIIELSKMYGFSKERISEIKMEAINSLKYSIRTKYLLDLYNSDKPYQEINLLSTRNHLKMLEETLIKLLIEECHLNKTESLSKVQRELLELRLGLNSNESYNLDRISEILGIGYTKIYNYRKYTLEQLKEIILKEYYHIEEIDSISYETYLDYLMKLYLSRSNNITKNSKLTKNKR